MAIFDFQKTVVRVLADKCISRSELEKISGVKRNAIYFYLTRGKEPPIGSASAILRSLGCSVRIGADEGVKTVIVDDYDNLVTAVRRKLADLGLSGNSACELAGVSHSVLERICAKHKSVGIYYVEAICTVLDIILVIGGKAAKEGGEVKGGGVDG